MGKKGQRVPCMRVYPLHLLGQLQGAVERGKWVKAGKIKTKWVKMERKGDTVELKSG